MGVVAPGEKKILVGERPQTHILDGAATETGHISFYHSLFGFYLYRVVPEHRLL